MKTKHVVAVPGPLGLEIEVVIGVNFDVEPSEPRTHDYPGYRGGPSNMEFECLELNVYDTDGNEVATLMSEKEFNGLFEKAKLTISDEDWCDICDESL